MSFEQAKFDLHPFLSKYNEVISKHCFVDLKALEKVCASWLNGTLETPVLKAANPLLDDLTPAATPRTPSSTASLSKESPIKPVVKKSTVAKSGKCPHVFKTGKQIGEKCGVGCEEGGFCSKHNKKEVEEVKEEKKEAVVKKTVAKTVAKTVPAVITKVKEANVDGNTTNIRKNKWNNYEEKNTGFVFNPSTEEVVGRQMADGTIATLTLNDIELCKANGFAYQIPERFKDEAPKKEKKEDLVDDDDLYEDEEEDD